MSMTPSRRTLESITLADLAVDNRLFVVRCNLCRKTEHYLAKDLAEVMGEQRLAHTVFYRCPHCGDRTWLNVKTRLPTPNDVGHLRIRRPVNRRVIWSWQDALL